jgi:hypothetical protein
MAVEIARLRAKIAERDTAIRELREWLDMVHTDG